MTVFEIMVLLLARTCVAEIGFQAQTEECVLMWEINQRNADRKEISLKAQTLNYNQYWQNKKQRAARPWIAYLESKSVPKFFPKNLRWKRHVKKWLEYKDSAKRFLKGGYDILCAEAIDYGSPTDKPAPKRKRIKCLNGYTKQRYYKLVD